MSRPLLPDAWSDYPTLTVREAVLVTGLSKRTIWRRIEQGKLATMESGGRRVLIITDSLVLMLKGLADDEPAADPRAAAEAADLLRRVAG